MPYSQTGSNATANIDQYNDVAGDQFNYVVMEQEEWDKRAYPIKPGEYYLINEYYGPMKGLGNRIPIEFELECAENGTYTIGAGSGLYLTSRSLFSGSDVELNVDPMNWQFDHLGGRMAGFYRLFAADTDLVLESNGPNGLDFLSTSSPYHRPTQHWAIARA